jgi:enoyl-CoA hydratase
MFQQIYGLRLAMQPCWHKAFVILSLSELILHFRCMEYIIVEPRYEKHIALIRLNRPKELNALHLELMAELRDALKMLDADEEVRVIVLTGNERAFAAGADIKQMAGKNAIDMLKIDQFSTWDQIKKTKKPIIAAVSGFALGGGNELVMHCDMVIASETAMFGQPEIKIGVMPGAGGTQRVPRAVGKVNAMEMVLTGKFISAQRAYELGLVNKVVPVELYLDEAVKLAREIALQSPIAIRLAKESVLKAYESSLSEGLEFERKNFYLLFATDDQKEGMAAFVEKRAPKFRGQ